MTDLVGRRDYRSPKPIVLSERQAASFWKYVDRSGGDEACWPWLGETDKQTSYGMYALGYERSDDEGNVNRRRKYAAHRVAWFLEYGEMPAGQITRHRCNNRPCCNVRHMVGGTHRENAADMIAAGRARFLGRKGEAHPRSRYSDELRVRAYELAYVEFVPGTWRKHSFAEIGRLLGCSKDTAARWAKAGALARGFEV